MKKDQLVRCPWGETDDEQYRNYHDQEWGKLNLDEKYLYEMLVLESFQSGLSWATILHKRDNFRKAFTNFEVEKVAQFDELDYKNLLQNKGIIRNKLKIQAAINNAQILTKWHQNQKKLANFLTHFVPQVIDANYQDVKQIPAKTELSQEISKAMKKAGFKFVGPTTIYSFLQAVGLVNDHLAQCSFRN